MTEKSKTEWTHELYRLAHGENSPIPNPNKKNIYVLYWYHNNKNFGFRLNNTAYDLLTNAGYEFYKHNIDRKKYQINGKELVLMDRYHKFPWFLKMSSGELFLMDTELSSILAMCDGNLRQAIEILA